MPDLELSIRILHQGRALVRSFEKLDAIQPTGPFERALAHLLMATYKRGCAACAVLTSTPSGNILCARDQEEPPPLGPLAGAARALAGYTIGAEYFTSDGSQGYLRGLAGGTYNLVFQFVRSDGVATGHTSPAFEIGPGETKRFEYTIPYGYQN